MKRLNLIHALRIGKSFMAPMVLLGLFLFIGTSEVSAQELKNYKDSQVILRAELADLQAVPVYTGKVASTTFSTKTDVNGNTEILAEAKRMFYSRVLRGINRDVDVLSVVDETLESFAKTYPSNSAMYQTLVTVHNLTVELLSN